MSTTINDGGLATQDSSEVRVYTFDYDDNLAAGVELASVGTFVFTPATGLTQDNQALVAGGRSARLRISVASSTYVGTTFRIENTVVTNESPSQTKSKWFKVKIT